MRRRGDHTGMVEQREEVVGCLRVYCAIIMQLCTREMERVNSTVCENRNGEKDNTYI